MEWFVSIFKNLAKVFPEKSHHKVNIILDIIGLALITIVADVKFTEFPWLKEVVLALIILSLVFFTFWCFKQIIIHE